MVKKYYGVVSGEERIFDTAKIHYLACCDCGLVHAVVMRQLPKKKIGMIMWRDECHTNICRELKKKHEKV